jgi:tRNA threonylcarbamoyladenosine biosynthesis protein TsaE
MPTPARTVCIDSCSADRTRELGENLGRVLRAGDVIGLSGPLGAGKTCLVQGVARGLGVDPGVAVTSPTFTLIGEYPGRLPLRHADFYRVESEQRLFEAGFDDLLDGRGVLIVEWFERFPDALPRERLEIAIELAPGGAAERRRLTAAAFGARARDLQGLWPGA